MSYLQVAVENPGFCARAHRFSTKHVDLSRWYEAWSKYHPPLAAAPPHAVAEDETAQAAPDTPAAAAPPAVSEDETAQAAPDTPAVAPSTPGSARDTTQANITKFFSANRGRPVQASIGKTAMKYLKRAAEHGVDRTHRPISNEAQVEAQRRLHEFLQARDLL